MKPTQFPLRQNMLISPLPKKRILLKLNLRSLSLSKPILSLLQVNISRNPQQPKKILSLNTSRQKTPQNSRP
ncbi:MAG: hypothetical protein QXQ53_08445, partial [Candidatus Methanosuratincola sp.]